MSGELTYLGRFGFADLLPVIGIARTQIQAVVTAVLPDVAARLAGALRLQLTIRPPSIAASIAVAIRTLASLQISIAPPGVDFAATAVAQLVTRLQLLRAALDLALNWGSFDGSAHLFVYTGDAKDMGATIAGAITGGQLGGVSATSSVIAPILMVAESDPVSKSTLQLLVRLS